MIGFCQEMDGNDVHWIRKHGRLKLHVKPLNRYKSLDGWPIMFYVNNNTNDYSYTSERIIITRLITNHYSTTDNDFRTDVLSILNAHARADTHHTSYTHTQYGHTSARTPNASRYLHNTSCYDYFIFYY